MSTWEQGARLLEKGVVWSQLGSLQQEENQVAAWEGFVASTVSSASSPYTHG